jgi:hypothetical protein
LCGRCRIILENEFDKANHDLLWHLQQPPAAIRIYARDVGCLEHNRGYASPSSLHNHARNLHGMELVTGRDGPQSAHTRMVGSRGDPKLVSNDGTWRRASFIPNAWSYHHPHINLRARLEELMVRHA